MLPTMMTTWCQRIFIDMETRWILYLFLVFIGQVGSQGSRSCPPDLDMNINRCLTSYTFHSQHLYDSPLKLCCGIDVETLRAYCHSYRNAVGCASHLKRSCPPSQHYVIDSVLSDLDDEVKAGIPELCADDSVIEAYAMYQSCYETVGRQSARCFTSHLKEFTAIRFLSKISTKHKDMFCTSMQDTVGCVHKHVKRACGEEAARLATLLVRPMVRDSAQCDYTSPMDKNMESSKQKESDMRSYVSDDGRNVKRPVAKTKPSSGTISNSNKNRRHKSKPDPGGSYRIDGSNTGGQKGSHTAKKGDNNNNSATNLLVISEFYVLFPLLSCIALNVIVFRGNNLNDWR